MDSHALDAVRLYRMDLPDHACPWGLRAVRLLQERRIPFEDHRLTSAEEVEAFKAAHGVATNATGLRWGWADRWVQGSGGAARRTAGSG